MEWLIGDKWWSALATWVEAQTGISPDTLGNLLNTLVVAFVLLGLRALIRRMVQRRVEDPPRRRRIMRVFNSGLGIVGLALLARIWVLGHVNLATYLGIASAGLAVALQDPICDLAGWLLIVARQPFKVGDRIQIGTHRGDVAEIRFFTVTLLEIGNWVDADQSTGRCIHVPNGRLFKEPCANYTQGFDYIWNEIPVVVTFESDWRKAHRVLTEIVKRDAPNPEAVARHAEEMAERYKVSYQHLTPIVYVSVVDSGVRLTIRYLCKARQRRSSTDKLWRHILDAFGADAALEFAYPTQRYFNNIAEARRTGLDHDSRASQIPG